MAAGEAGGISMEPSQLEGLFGSSPIKHYPKRQIIIYEGDPPTNIYLIVKGYVKVYNILGTGAQRIIFIYGPGDTFPLTSFLSQAGVVRYFYETITEVEVRILPAAKLEGALRNDIETGEKLIRYTMNVNQQFFQRIDSLAAKDAKRKIVSLLNFLVAKAGTEGPKSRIGVPLTSQDIADMCGLTRETASSQMQNLRKAGVITGFKALTVNLPKLDKLREGIGIPQI